ncbi:ribosomal protein L11 methyltransferase [Puia dinghuensis]|uniref:Ribosomal protein L11 methyltransferase n=2 Tax=Puia dinghuensis TaxID=1792502 RepID=A0A8J2U6Q7_9BACT|nr:ribosomal protein L11 methyltransferase [Puia dinghuensis]
MIEISIATAEWQEVLIALLGELGYEGFEQQEEWLRAYVTEEHFDRPALEAVLNSFGLTYEEQRLEERNWNEEWEKNFQPVVVDSFCAIRAHFHAPIAAVEHELVITPKMSFGTGHHATTFMMIKAMRDLDLRGKRVLDFGTGTGVLAILAERLGAVEVVAIDNDDWSIANAQENIEMNGCKAVKVLKLDQVGDVPGGPFDVILANINKHVILTQLPALGQQLGEGGVILMSGLLEDDFKDVENEALGNNLLIFLWMTKGAWICVKGRKMTAQG